jgi:uncharacterized protein with HEPN domain
VLKFTEAGFDSLYSDDKTKLAVERCFEIIGEAVAKLSDETKTKYPDVGWRDIKDFRNKLAHDYFDIDYGKVWKIIVEELPTLKVQIAQIINEVYGEDKK